MIAGYFLACGSTRWTCFPCTATRCFTIATLFAWAVGNSILHAEGIYQEVTASVGLEGLAGAKAA